MTQLDYALSATVPARERKSIPLRVYLSKDLKPGNHLITADVFTEGMAFREWAETIVTVSE